VRYDDRFIEELKSRVRLSEAIGRSVKLRRQGREWVGLSPFNKEKSPSFFVNDDKGFWHDFSSGKHGDLLSFWQETERLSFREALERLATEAGVELPQPDARSAQQEEKRQGLQDWLETAAKWFAAQLRRPAGEAARAYLLRRGLPEAEWARFGLGYAPADRSGLKDALIQRGAKPAELVEAGLLIAPEGGGAPYDRFRDRVIFPITDGRGRVVSFGGRALDPEARAKYLNGPESPLFHKGRTLYGLPEARKLLAQNDRGDGQGAPLVVVEGYMDAIACWRAEVAAVAPLGTALTEDQLGLLWRQHSEPTLSFDGDKAGLRAAHRAIDTALPLLQPGRSLRFSLLEGGQDPDDLLRDKGPAALREVLTAARPLVDVLWERERSAAEPLDTPERRAGLKARLRHLAAAIADPDLSAAYKQELLRRYDAVWAPTADERSRAGVTLSRARWSGDGRRRGKPLPGGASPEGRQAARRISQTPAPLTAAVALGLLRAPARADHHLESLAAQGFGDAALQPLAGEIVAACGEAAALDPALLRRRLDAAGFDELIGRLEAAAARSGVSAPFLDPSHPPEEADALWAQAYDVVLRIAALERAFEDARADLHTDADSAALIRIKTERDDLQRRARSGAIFDSSLH
jgi:DNA primase